MSTESGNYQFDTVTIPSQRVWFDPIGARFFANKTKASLIIKFSHTMRSIEIIDITEPPSNTPNQEALEVLKGEIIEEEVY